MRTIKVKSTQGKRTGSFTSNATTFGQLKEELLANGFSYSDSLQVSVQSTQSALLTDDSVVPAGDQTIFMYPKETKSGWVPSGFGTVLEEEEIDVDELIERKKELTQELAEIQSKLDYALFAGKVSETPQASEEYDEDDIAFAKFLAAQGR